MALTFNETFPVRGGNQAAKKDQTPAVYWLNIGYQTEVQTEEGTTEVRFVSLPLGIPLDTQELLKTNSRNESFAQFQAARNDLHAQIMDLAKGLEPGEETILALDPKNGLAIQLRRVNEATAAVVDPAANPFARKLKLAA
jgi:hypothetical protein